MAERKRFECRNHGNCLWRLEYMTSCDGHLPEWDGERHVCEEYEPMPDTKGLLKLADEIDSIASFAEEAGRASVSMGTGSLREIERRIREALGVEA